MECDAAFIAYESQVNLSILSDPARRRRRSSGVHNVHQDSPNIPVIGSQVEYPPQSGYWKGSSLHPFNNNKISVVHF